MMTIADAAMFFVGSILVMLGLIVITAGIVAINIIVSRYWKPVRIFWPIHSIEEYTHNEHTKQPSGSKKDRAGTAGNQQQSDKV
jgi:hypothetical protein